jgi:hypothetical protein
MSTKRESNSKFAGQFAIGPLLLWLCLQRTSPTVKNSVSRPQLLVRRWLVFALLYVGMVEAASTGIEAEGKTVNKVLIRIMAVITIETIFVKLI